MKVLINGAVKSYDNKILSIADLLVIEGIALPEMVSVQWNGQFVDTSLFVNTHVNEDDEVDFLYFMGGGENIGWGEV